MLKKDGIRRLIKEIDESMPYLENLARNINERTSIINNTNVDIIRDGLVDGVAKAAERFYTGIESILELIILKAFDEQVLDRSGWHQELLNMAADDTPERPQVISSETFKLLKQLKSFRHFSTKAYKEAYDWRKMNDLGPATDEAYQLLQNDLRKFCEYLRALMDALD